MSRRRERWRSQAVNVSRARAAWLAARATMPRSLQCRCSVAHANHVAAAQRSRALRQQALAADVSNPPREDWSAPLLHARSSRASS
mmetsp:Transcript_10534/g.28680  ORF Transcript_10534/g.28680 Transcript_10534/m.28680 type:complete len:86 (-) Transcript_10534:1005-1262(-)